MKNQKGFTLAHILLTLLIISILVVVTTNICTIWLSFANNRGATEKRAYTAANYFVAKNQLQTKRLTCAGDSDGDGYGSCTLILTDGEKIRLECVSDFMDTKIYGAKGCKEMDIQVKGMRPLIGM